MKFASLLLSFLFAAITISAQVNPQCPSVSISGPMGMVDPSELIPYTANVKPTESKLTYKWTAVGGTIANGQGEPTIKVRLELGASNLTVTVEVGGLSDECSNRASETVSDLAGNQSIATKLGTFSLPFGSISDDRFKSIAAALNKDLTSQLYVLVPTNRSAWTPLMERLDKYTHSDFDPTRITFVEVNGTNNIVEVWLVPPGAKPPSKCEACDESKSTKPDCPAISITGPAGPTERGDTMEFRVVADPALPPHSRFAWTVSTGRIELGQGTSSIIVRVPEDSTSVIVKANVKISGLVKGCTASAEETAGIIETQIGDPLDQYGQISLFDEYARMQSGVAAALQDKNSLLIIIRQSPRYGAADKARIRALKQFIVNRLHFPKSRFMIINRFGPQYDTTIWILPIGAKFPG
jgi:hypothetical protein